MSEYVYFRVDAGPKIGIGHLIRCLSIANYLSQLGYCIHFFCKDHNMAPLHFIRQHDYDYTLIPLDESFKSTNMYDDWLGSTQEWDANFCLKEMKGACSIMIVDHYGISDKWETLIQRKIKTILVIDDLANRQHDCQFLVDSGIGRSALDYHDLVSNQCKFMLGIDYTLLKQAYYRLSEKAKLQRNNTRSISRVLLAFGGTDNLKLSKTAIQAIRKMNTDIEIDMVISSSCEWLESEMLFFDNTINLSLHIDCDYVEKLILNADFAVGSFGVSAIERCILGLPSLNCKIAENQSYQSSMMTKKGYCLGCDMEELSYSITKILNNNSKLISNELLFISSNCFRDFNVNGMVNVVKNIMMNNDQCHYVSLNSHHIDTLYFWQTQSDTRKYFKNIEIPTYEQHEKWFTKTINNEKIRMWMIIFDNQLCGYIRLDELDDIEEVSIFIDRNYRGKNIAQSTLEWLKEKSKYKKLLSTIHDENVPSIHLFRHSGYVSIGEGQYLWEHCLETE